MAIILEGVDHSPVMWGKIGKHLVQRTKLGKMFIKIKVTPANPKTPIQQEKRSALTVGVLRWKNFEKLFNKDYWDLMAVDHRFRDGYRAFLSSFLVTYRMKLSELGDHTQALEYVSNTSNPITYQESPKKIRMEERDRRLIKAIYTYRKTKSFMRQLGRSLKYLDTHQWLNVMRYGILPDSGKVIDDVWYDMGIIPPYEPIPKGNFGTGKFGRGVFGGKRVI